MRLLARGPQDGTFRDGPRPRRPRGRPRTRTSRTRNRTRTSEDGKFWKFPGRPRTRTARTSTSWGGLLLAIFESRVLNESVQWNEIVFVGWWMMVRVKYWTQRMITRSCDGILNKLSNSILALIFKDYTNHLESVKLKFLERPISSSNGIFLFLKIEWCWLYDHIWKYQYLKLRIDDHDRSFCLEYTIFRQRVNLQLNWEISKPWFEQLYAK